MALRFARLTRLNIRQLRSGEKITEYGITAECLKDGDIRYTVNIMVDGQRIHRVVGKESENTTRSQAEAFIEKTQSRVEKAQQRLLEPLSSNDQAKFLSLLRKLIEANNHSGRAPLRTKSHTGSK
ncbi:MAG: hypothetical protein QGF71_00230 [Rhodospirillales bacterium]|nr:hypothetical protein [Rhodospirillales bacterium]